MTSPDVFVPFLQAVTMAKSGQCFSPLSRYLSSCCSLISAVVILPIIGVLMTEGLSNHTSLYPKDQKSKSDHLDRFSGNTCSLHHSSAPFRRHVSFWYSKCP